MAATCYPGEDLDDPAVYTRDRFDMYCVKNDCHVVMDNLYPFEDGLLVASRWLHNPQFSIDRWYWHQIGQMTQIPDKEIRRLEHRQVGFNLPMGRPVEDQIIGRLIRGRSTNLCALIDEDTQFTCIYREDIKTYIVTDMVLRTCFHLPLYKTENPRFNVTQWYRQHIQ